MNKRIIWSNRDINPDLWQEDYDDYVRFNNLDKKAYVLWDYIHESLNAHLDDERMNLDVSLNGRILAIADLGLWDGRKQGCKILGANANQIFDIHEDYNEYYTDGYNVKATCVHHDGVNYIEYRIIREDRNIQNLLDVIYSGEEITRKKLNYYTKSLHPYVAKVYGW